MRMKSLAPRALPTFLLLLAIAVLGAAITPSARAAGATRTWVSGVGDDANPCSRTAPCKTFAGAISKTEIGGEIDALDSGGFGAVTITKSITLDAAGFKGGIANGGTNGIIINSATADVVLRGIDIAGAASGAAPCVFTGLNGIRILAAHSVRIEDTTINAMSANGLDIVSSSPVTVGLDRVTVSNTCGVGVNVAPTGGASATLLAKATTITGAGTAVSVGDGGHAWLDSSTIFGNTLGLAMTGSGIIDSSADTTLFGNGAGGAAPATIFNAPPAGPAGAPGAAGANGVGAMAIAVASPKLRARAGSRVVVRYGLSSPATSTVLLKRGGKVVAKVAKVKGKAGANAFGLVTKLKGAPLKPGAYTLTIAAVRADGVTATTTLSLKLVR